MPEITEFNGIHIYMYFKDHNPPHIHAEYSGKEAMFNLDGDLIEGFIPRKQKRMVQGWVVLHEDEIYENWKTLQADGSYKKIAPLK